MRDDAGLMLTYAASMGDQNPLSVGIPLDLFYFAGAGRPIGRTDDRKKQNAYPQRSTCQFKLPHLYALPKTVFLLRLLASHGALGN